MIRLIKIFSLLLVLVFSVSTSGTSEKQSGKLNLDCDERYVKDGEIVLVVEDLPTNDNHPAVCVSLKRQNSILWKTKKYEAFNIKIEPLIPANAPYPFCRPASELVSVKKVLSSGLPKSEEENVYKVTVEILDKEGGNVIRTIDPHIKV